MVATPTETMRLLEGLIPDHDERHTAGGIGSHATVLADMHDIPPRALVYSLAGTIGLVIGQLLPERDHAATVEMTRTLIDTAIRDSKGGYVEQGLGSQ